jgi:hypothetical protein
MAFDLTPGGEYGRSVRVVVGPRDGGEANEWTSDSLQSVAPGVPPTLVTGLRIGFDIKRDSASEPSQGVVKLFNLSPASRAWLQSDGLSVRVEAGYGESTRALFVADVADVYHEKQASEWVTTIEGGDGESGYRDGRISFSGAPGITRRRVFDELARSIGVPLGVVPPIASTAYRTGVTLVGPARQYLDDLCDELGLRWSVQDGALQVIPRNGATTEQAVVISPEAGLIGRTALRRADDGTAGVKFRVRLNGIIAPGRAVVIDDGDVSGTYVVEKAFHKGDSGYGAEYTTAVEATEAS